MTARPARLQPPHFDRRPGAPATAGLIGVVDLAVLAPGAAIDRRDRRHQSVVSAPGLEVAFDTEQVAWQATKAALTFAFGRPTLDGAAAPIEAVADALAADPVPWVRVGGRHAVIRIDRATGEVLLATDRFGMCPLAWARQGTRIAFSDRADRIAADSSDLDPQALFDYLYFHVIPAPRTVFRGVQRIEPATALRASALGMRSERTWHPAFARNAPRAGAPRRAQFVDAVRAAVLGAAGDGAVGCFLSGGTDSSTVAGMLARARGGADTFSIGFDADGYDEMAYARLAAKHFGTTHHEYYITPDDLVQAMPVVAAHYDQPFGNSSAVPAYYCALMARHHGVARMLAGDGGDELFGGNLRYARQKLFEAYRAVPEPLRRRLVEPALLNPVARALPGVRKAASYVAQASVPMPARTETYNLLERFGAEHVFTPRFLEQVDAAAPAALQARVYAASEGAAFVDRMLAYDWRFTLADNDLPKVTGTTRLAGLDVGFPLLADPVVDLSTTLAARDKVDGQRLRHFFKEALADFLPPEIIAKKKHGFGLPVGPWLVSDPPFRAFAYEAAGSLTERGLIRPALVDDLFSRRLEQHPGYYGEMVWILTMLEHWLRAQAPAWSVD